MTSPCQLACPFGMPYRKVATQLLANSAAVASTLLLQAPHSDADPWNMPPSDGPLERRMLRTWWNAAGVLYCASPSWQQVLSSVRFWTESWLLLAQFWALCDAGPEDAMLTLLSPMMIGQTLCQSLLHRVPVHLCLQLWLQLWAWVPWPRLWCGRWALCRTQSLHAIWALAMLMTSFRMHRWWLWRQENLQGPSEFGSNASWLSSLCSDTNQVLKIAYAMALEVRICVGKCRAERLLHQAHHVPDGRRDQVLDRPGQIHQWQTLQGLCCRGKFLNLLYSSAVLLAQNARPAERWRKGVALQNEGLWWYWENVDIAGPLAVCCGSSQDHLRGRWQIQGAMWGQILR